MQILLNMNTSVNNHYLGPFCSVKDRWNVLLRNKECHIIPFILFLRKANCNRYEIMDVSYHKPWDIIKRFCTPTIFRTEESTKSELMIMVLMRWRFNLVIIDVTSNKSKSPSAHCCLSYKEKKKNTINKLNHWIRHRKKSHC